MDWDVYNRATAAMYEGRPKETLWLYQSLTDNVETEDERAVLLTACGGCYARLGNREEAFHCIAAAHSLRVVDSIVRSQIDLAEGNLHLLCGDYERAAQMFTEIAISYRDELGDPEQQDFAQELKSRYADSLTFLGRYSEAIPLLRELVAANSEYRQRSLLYLGICLANSGSIAEGRDALAQAARGEDAQTASEARERLAQLI
jgi:tetratricopeptide (TPR) repeat protein